MRRSARVLAGLGALSAAATTALLVSCLSDPRADEAVSVVNACDTALLSSDPTSVDPTLRVYFETTKAALDATQKADAALKEACLEIYTEASLGLTAPPGATTGAAACQPLLTRIADIVKKQPVVPGLNVIAPWVTVLFGQRCVAPAGLRSACLSSCGATCDVSKCAPEKLAGKCTGECTGTCTTTTIDGDGGACAGTCVGEIPLANTGGAVPGQTCQGECVGACAGQLYTGRCEGACARGFSGRCGGTCHGKCNGTPTAEMDAGTVDSGKDPDADAGPPAAPLSSDPPQPLPNNPGNCGTGLCEGTCSDHADGTCFSRCINYAPADGGLYTTSLAPFSGGECAGFPCIGTCRSAGGSGSAKATGAVIEVGACKGECTQLTKPRPPLPTNTTCDGICRPLPGADAGAPCDVPLDQPFCEGALNCGQNQECANACEAKAALESVCADPLVLQAYAVTNPELYAAFRKHQAVLAKAVSLLRKAQTAYSFIGNRNYGDFVALGAKGDLAYACAVAGAKNMTDANAILAPALGADPTTVRYLK